MTNLKSKVIMLGSTPMSLEELPLAPAIISSVIKNKGYEFEFIDINLELFDYCKQDRACYQERTELLQDILEPSQDLLIAQWQQSIIDRLEDCSYLVVNVFSHFSQGAALRLVRLVRQHCPEIVVFMGGIGSQKHITGADNQQTRAWIDQMFNNTDSVVFGQLLLNNGLIDNWQADTTTSELEKIPTRNLILRNRISEIDFSSYRINEYQWPGHKTVPILGSHGCVRQCSFCDVIKHYPAYSFIEADQLSKQIVSVYQQTGIGRFSFMDSLVNGSMKNFESLLSNLDHSRKQGWLPTDFSWSGTYICRPRSKQLDRIHKLLPQSGVDNLVIGVETGSDRIRFDMDKKFTNQDLLYELSAFRSNKVKTSLLFFPSWPTETSADFEDTLLLFANLSEYAQQYVIDHVSLGSSGFVLIDGTPVDLNKDAIGLEAGPTPFLWKCHSNPDLNFWETIRRRLLMTSVCEHFGIKLTEENIYRRYLSLKLNRYRDIILSYCGTLQKNIIDNTEVLNNLPNQHCVRLSIVNSGQHNAVLSVQDQQFICKPGTTECKFDLIKPFDQSLLVEFQFKFDSDYQPDISCYESGDYYSKTGLYINHIQVDHRDITLWGFNQITQQRFLDSAELPTDYHLHNNQRCVMADTTLLWHVPENIGLQAWLLKNLHKSDYQERVFVDQRLYKEINWYAQN
jgi:Radical SAM superfamily